MGMEWRWRYSASPLAVDITRQQALDLLKKWQVERRLIQGGIFQSKKYAISRPQGALERADCPGSNGVNLPAFLWTGHSQSGFK